MSKQALRQLKKAAYSKKTKQKLAHLRVISGSGRFRILVLLHERPTGLRVTEIAGILNASTSRISHQMRILRKNGLVVAEPIGREKIYVSRFKNSQIFA